MHGSVLFLFFPLCFLCNLIPQLDISSSLHFFCTSFWRQSEVEPPQSQNMLSPQDLHWRDLCQPSAFFQTLQSIREFREYFGWTPHHVFHYFFSAFPKISENIAGPGHICENVSNSIYGVLQWVEPAFPLPGFADRSSVECQRLLDLGWTKMALAHVTWRATGDIGLPQNLWFVVNFPIQMVVKWCWQCQFRVVLRAAWGDFEQVPPTSNSLVPPTSNSLCRQRLFVSSGLNHKHQIEVQSLYILWN